MAANITDLLTQATVSTRPTPTTVSSIRAAAGSTLQCLALTGWPTGTAVHFVTYKINTSGAKVAGSQIDMKGVVSGTTITNVTIKAGSDVGNAIGDIVECAPTAAFANDLYTWGSAHANQDGSLIGSAVRTALNQTAATGAGWTTLGYTINTVTANGNRSYDLVVNGSDTTGVTSVGQRLLLPRTVTAPTGSITLNGTTQYANKTSPSGMTFTDDFVVSAWVKLSAYSGSTQTIASRYNGTSGWALYVLSSGIIALYGYNAGSGNVSLVQTYQSIPLNKWVHIGAQLDMSTFTATTTTSYVMLDGVNVPSSVVRSGTNPTALIQAGNLEIGSQNAGTLPFTGQIAQVAIYSAKVTQATILASMNQTLTGSETSIVSAYKLDQASGLNDLSANANNLTAQGSPSYSTTQTPFTNDVTGTSVTAGTTNYGIIMKQTFSTNTTYTIQIPEGETLPTTGGIGTVSYSTQSVPYGFPKQRSKWTVKSIYRTVLSQVTPVADTWYNLGSASLTIPAGQWDVNIDFPASGDRNTAGTVAVASTLSTSSSSETNTLYTQSREVTATGATGTQNFGANRSGDYEDLSAATPYYALVRTRSATMQTIYQLADRSIMKIEAVVTHL